MKRFVITILAIGITATLYNMDGADRNSSNNTITSMPKKDMSLNAYPTLNAHGYSFEQTDPISAQFIQDISEHRAKNPVTIVGEVGPGYCLLAEKVLAEFLPQNECYYTTIELHQEHLSLGTERMKNNGILNESNINRWQPYCHCGSFPHVTFQPNSLSHLALIRVLHFSTPEKIAPTLRAIESALESKGKAFIYTSSSETEAYGPFFHFYYTVRKYLGYEFPGYINNAPALVNTLVSWGLFPRERAENPTFKNSLAQNFLFFSTTELCEKIKKYTTLKILSSQTIHEHQNDKRKSHVGIIVEKV